MANKRIFVSFAMEDLTQKLLFCGQAKNANVPYEFVDMSVKQPWDSTWKANCRTRIKGCDGVIVLVSPNLKNASGALWEVKCAIEERKRIMGIYISGGNVWSKPSEMLYVDCKTWTWDNVKNFIHSL
ncbi:TIR domain-containing protein [Sphingobacterium chungjuense]|uniref:TIR domain-containing protein n=1 Tax=Sphingobacterium chungjuense TaxID=2675553 RepID=UPI00140D10D8|nr:TIR domain-containing protein [Sphingobacterium chungjuense]